MVIMYQVLKNTAICLGEKGIMFGTYSQMVQEKTTHIQQKSKYGKHYFSKSGRLYGSSLHYS